MTLLQFIRLMVRNAFALVVVPIFLAGLVFFLTRNEEKKYISKTSIYTGIASGYSIESQANSRVDFFAVNNAFDNLINIIKARSTSEETALRLLAQHVSMEEEDERFISHANFLKLDKDYPENLRYLIEKGHELKTFEKLKEHSLMSDTNYFQRLYTSDHPHYSTKAVSKFSAWRVQNSDILEISFESNDPGVCQNTLLLLSEIFIKKFAAIRINQTDQVVNYFENQLRISAKKLSNAEDKLLNFNQKNSIINYNEQTRNISSRKEELDKQYYEIQMLLAGANAVIYKLEEQLSESSQIRLSNSELTVLRSELSDVASRLAFARIPSPYDTTAVADTKKIAALQSKSDSLKTILRNQVDSLIFISQGPDGIAAEDILNSWLENVILAEENYAKQEVIQKRRLEFLEIYKTFAPLGATLKRIEREINVVEQEYLQLLHSLSLAKLKQQNNLLASSVRVIDPPDFPLKAERSKRKILILAGGMFGFILVAFTVLALAYINPNIQRPVTATKKTGLDVVCVLPTMLVKPKRVDFAYINQRLIEMWMQSLLQDVKGEKQKFPTVIGIGSSRISEGKSYTTLLLIERMREFQKKVLYLTYLETGYDYNDVKHDDLKYEIGPEFISLSKVEELIPSQDLHLWSYDLVVIEYPPINENPLPQRLLSIMNAFYLVINANRAWTKADSFSLNFLETSLAVKPKIFLNGVSLDVVEDYIGQIPKQRNLFHRFVAKLLRLQFFRKLFKK